MKDTGVLECRIFNNSKFYTGVAVLTGAFNIYLVNNIKEPRIRKMPAVPGIGNSLLLFLFQIHLILRIFSL